MKIRTEDLATVLDAEMQGFNPISLSREEYADCISYAGSHFICTEHLLILLEKKKCSNETNYFAVPISTAIKVSAREVDLVTRCQKLRIELFNGNEMTTVTVDSDVLTSQGAKKLLQFGCVYNENHVKKLLTYLSNAAFNAPLIRVHSSLGWNFSFEEPIFLGIKQSVRPILKASTLAVWICPNKVHWIHGLIWFILR